LLALLLGQWTVLAHSIAHARTPAGATAAADTVDGWGHNAGTRACHLVDHLLAGQAPGSEPTALPCLPRAATKVAVAAASIGSGPIAQAYEARGPPRA